tara:strand:- start:931 stop:1317 length:387 start_codon:yes stop_codon:yes gene_type:complete
MASKKITFDPIAGVPYAANLTIFGGANFSADFTVVDTGNAAYNFTGWSGSAQLAKSVAVGATMGALATFNVGFTSAYDGKFNLSLGSTATGLLAEGRYVYNVLVSSGTTIYSIANGNILVYAGISSAP